MKKNKVILGIFTICLAVAVMAIAILVTELNGYESIENVEEVAQVQKEAEETKEPDVENNMAEGERVPAAESTEKPSVTEASRDEPYYTQSIGKPIDSKQTEQQKETVKPKIEPTIAPVKSPMYRPTSKPEQTKTPISQEVADETQKLRGTITLSVDTTVMGNGMVLSNKSVEIYPNERVSHVVDRGLKEAGYEYSCTGSKEKMFYLSGIKKERLIKQVAVPQRVLDILDENDVTLRLTKYKSDSLREFDFTGFSGWRYSVNGMYPGVGMSEYDLKDGDSIVLKYTLCLGYDA